jgi:DNA-binding CsgD family transcriptional regulator
MRRWQAQATTDGRTAAAIGGMVRALAQDDFQATVLCEVQPVLPAASWSVYRTGADCSPQLFMSASRGTPDRTRECWWAYLSGPHRQDRSFSDGAMGTALDRANGTRSGDGRAPTPSLCHITAQEVAAEHRARVYEAHGVRERVSVVEQDRGTIFAVNLYRHEHQAPFTDAQIDGFGNLAVPLLALARKHIGLTTGASSRPASLPLQRGIDTMPPHPMPAGQVRERLLAMHGELTPRELDVCVRLAQGMTQDSIAAELGLGATTVKTYRNRAFARLGIHFRNELFARLLRFSRP